MTLGGEPDSKSLTARPVTRQFNPDTYRPRTLRSEMEHRGRLAFEECLRLGLSLSNALGHLHKNGLIHRDIKPSNIMFVHGVAKLADIGLVADVGEARSFVGTEGFIPPEGPGTAQADIYSLGKVLYEMCTGKDRHAFPELPSDLAEAESRAELVEMNEVILKACQSQVAKRYQSTDELQRDLILLQSGKSAKQSRTTRRRRSLIKKFVIAPALLLAGLVVFLTIEHFRGKMALENWKKAMTAKGEKFTVAEWAPPPAAKEEPATRLLEEFGKRINAGPRRFRTGPVEQLSVPIMKYVAPGKARLAWTQEELPRYEISSWPNDFGLRADVAATNTWEYFSRRVEESRRLLEPLRGLVAHSARTLGLDYKDYKDWKIPTLLPRRVAAQWLGAAAVDDLRRGRLAALARLYQEEPSLVMQMFKASITGTGIDYTWEALQAPGWNEEQLARLQEAWQAVDITGHMAQAYEMERAQAVHAFEVARRASFHEFEQKVLQIERKKSYGLIQSDPTNSTLRKYLFFPVWRFAWSHQDELFFLKNVQPVFECQRLLATSVVPFKPAVTPRSTMTTDLIPLLEFKDASLAGVIRELARRAG